MKNSETINRRRFFQTGLLGSTALAASATFPAALFAGATKPDREPCHGLKLGITSYTFRKFTLEQAIAMTQQAGAKYISLKDVHLPLKSTQAERQAARKKVADAGLILLGGGVIEIKNKQDAIRDIFEYAKDAGLPTIICSPEPEALDTVEKMARQYDIRIAIHNHGPTDKRFPSPLDVLRAVKDRDALMGICMDVGHTVRLGQDPVAVMQQCASRLYDFHIKDVTEPKASGKTTEAGKGVIDLVGVLTTLVKMKFPYHVALEYEANADAPMPGVIESLAYMRGVLAAV
jgi:inosose dehydratase